MAEIRSLVDDIDGSRDDVETVTFSLMGRMWEIDLDEANRQIMFEGFDLYIRNGREITPAKKSGQRTRRGNADRRRSHEIRTWAKQQGMNVSDHGRLSGSVTAAWKKAHSDA